LSACRTAVLISGSGTNLQSFIDRSDTGLLDLDLCVVFSNRPDAYGLVRASEAGIPTVCIEQADFASRESFDRTVAAELDRFRPELLILAGFLRILSPWFVAHYEGRVLNIHPALLPDYPGLDTHARVLEAGDAWHGSTVHFVTEELDGGPRILQGRLRVNHDETVDELHERVLAIEHRIYPQAADWFARGRLEFRHGAAWFDGRRLDEPVVVDFDD
jgi:phosphoribosylglycinamide formyltransferase 1